MVVGSASQGPVEIAVSFGNRQVIDAGMATLHQAALHELPVFVALGTRH
jgi:hypothetical protein